MTYQELQDFIKALTDKEQLIKHKEIQKVYSASLKEINRQMAEVYAGVLSGVDSTNYYAEMIKYDRLDKLKISLLKVYKPYGKDIKNLVVASSRQSFANNYYYKQYSINWLSPYSFVVVPDAALELSVYRNKELVKKAITPAQKALIPKTPLTLTQLLAKNNLNDFNRVFDSISSSLLTGKGYRETAKELSEVFSGNYRNTLKTVRTEGHRNLESGGFQNWEEAKTKGVEGIRQILSTLDSSTRRQSALVDNKKDFGKGFLYPNGQRYFIPGNTGVKEWDINDRETVIEIINGQAPSVRRGRNPTTGKNEVISFTDFPTWAKDNGLKRNIYGELVT